MIPLLIPAAYGMGIQTYSGWDAERGTRLNRWGEELGGSPPQGPPREIDTTLDTLGVGFKGGGEQIAKVKLDRDQQQRLDELVGARARSQVAALIKEPDWKSYNAADRKTLAERVIDDSREWARMQFVQEFPQLFRGTRYAVEE